MSTVTVSGLSVALGGRPVLTDVTFELEQGEFVGLLGPNGAGKTTLMRCLLGLVAASSGSITVAGEPDLGIRRDAVGYIPQRHDVAWALPLSVYDVVLGGRLRTIGWFRQPRAHDHAAVATALRRVAMADLADRPVGELSGGQRQRVLIARALAKHPAVLLLDEPFTGLDMPTQELLSTLFRDLADDGETLLMATHDLPGAAAICDRLLLIRRRIIADGVPEALREPEPWSQTFQVTPHSPLLAGLGLHRDAEGEHRC